MPYMSLLVKHVPKIAGYTEKEFMNNETLAEKVMTDSVLFHYGTCSYYILDGAIFNSRRNKDYDNWEEEWDNWDEVVGRAYKIVKLGVEDYHKGIHFVDEHPISYVTGDIKRFRHLYQEGQKYAKYGTPSEGIWHKY